MDKILKLDIRWLSHPYNTLKVLQMLQGMECEKVLEVILEDGEPLHRVTEEVRKKGYKITQTEKLQSSNTISDYRIWIQKAGRTSSGD